MKHSIIRGRPRAILAAGGLLATLAAVSLMAPAAASEVYDTGDPYDGQEISYSPNVVTIRFTEPVRFEKAALEDESGRALEVRYGISEDDTDSISVRIPGRLPPGRYRLNWIAYVPAHRHSDDGTVRFTVLAPR